jgi:hypothetical protein
MEITATRDEFESSISSLWSNLKGHVPTKAETKAANQRDDELTRENKERERRGEPALPRPPKSNFGEGDLDAAVAQQLKKPGSVSYDQPNPAIAEFVLRIAKATAKAKIKGSQEFEKMMIICPDPAKPGDFRVRWIGLSGSNGGRLPATAPGEVIVHVHYAGLDQPPHLADFSCALDGRVSYVIGQDGTKVWEVRRNDQSIAIDPKNPAGRLQAVDVSRVMPGGNPRVERFKIKPERYSPDNQ